MPHVNLQSIFLAASLPILGAAADLSRSGSAAHTVTVDLNDVRPWFYTWSLMSRLFPRGTRTLGVRQPGVPHLRVVAGTNQQGEASLSVMLVNTVDEARAVTLSVFGAGRKTLVKYHYFDPDRPSDANGFPVPKETLPDADWEGGVTVSMPSSGIVFLSTP